MVNELKSFPIRFPHGSKGSKYPCMAIGTYGLSETELLGLFKAYHYDELLIDTAYRYDNEKEVSSAIMKSGYPKGQVRFIGKISYSQQVSGRSIREELHGTLNRLKIDIIDFYLIHSPRYEGFHETWQQLQELRHAGHIKEIGVSNFSKENIEKLYELSGEYPAVNQIVYNPFNQTEQTEQLINFCSCNNISIQVAMPFGGCDNSSKLDEEKRRRIITSLCNSNLLSIIGTHQHEHMIQNFQVLEELKSVYSP